MTMSYICCFASFPSVLLLTRPWFLHVLTELKTDATEFIFHIVLKVARANHLLSRRDIHVGPQFKSHTMGRSSLGPFSYSWEFFFTFS